MSLSQAIVLEQAAVTPPIAQQQKIVHVQDSAKLQSFIQNPNDNAVIIKKAAASTCELNQQN
jgi:hypothetical protein